VQDNGDPAVSAPAPVKVEKVAVGSRNPFPSIANGRSPAQQRGQNRLHMSVVERKAIQHGSLLLLIASCRHDTPYADTEKQQGTKADRIPFVP
jgi:hypothetical protein